jgi:hypothetical protein
MKEITLMTFLVLSLANVLANTCSDQVQTVLDQSVGVYYTENELDYDSLAFDQDIYLRDDYETVYTVRSYNNDLSLDGWIYFSTDCRFARATFPFGDYDIEL